MSSKSLISKLKIWVFLIALIPIIISALIYNITQKDSLNQTLLILGTQMQNINQATMSVGDVLTKSQRQVESLASNPRFVYGDYEVKTLMMGEYLREINGAIFVRYYQSTHGADLALSLDSWEIPPLSDKEAVRVLRTLSGQVVRPNIYFTSEHKPVVNYTVPVMDVDESSPVGALSVEICMTHLFGSMDPRLKRASGLVFITDEQGRILHITGVQRATRDALKIGGTTRNYFRGGHELSREEDCNYLISSLPIQGSDMFLVWKTPMDEIESIALISTMNIAGVVIFSLLLALLLSLFIARRLEKPMEELLENTQVIARDIAYDQISEEEEVLPGQSDNSDEINILVKTSSQVRQKLKNYLRTSKDRYSRTRDHLETKVQELQSIHQITEAFTTFRDFPELLKFIIEQFQNLFNAQFCCIYLKEEDNDSLTLRMSRGLDDKEKSLCSGVFPIEQEPYLEIAESLNSLVIQDVSNEDNLRDRFGDADVGSYCGLPLFVGENLFGILELGLEKERALSEGTINFMITLAKEASIAIENARLYKRVLNEKERLETVLSTISDGVVTMDSSYRITSFNSAAERITGFSREEMIDRPCFEVFKGTGSKDKGRELLCNEMECVLQTAYEQNQFPLNSEHIIVNPKGKTLTLEFSTTTDLNESSGKVTYFSVFRDISKVKELERLRADFIDTISHELRTPLTSIKGYVSTLLHPKAKFTPEETLEFLGIINDETNRLNRMINDLLEASKLHRDALLIKPQPFRIEQSIDDLLLKYRATSAKHEFVVRMEDLSILYGDVNQIEFVLNHLLENAVKFSPEGGKVKLTVTGGKEDVTVIIEDEGIGVPEEHREKIFNLFHRVDNRSIRRVYGPGLGLFISKKIIEAHGRRIWVESGLSGGAKFVFNIPRYQGNEPVEVSSDIEEEEEKEKE